MKLLAVAAVVVAVLWPTGEALHARWTDTQNLGDTHGYLVAAVSVFLLWRAGREQGAADLGAAFNWAWIGVAMFCGAGVLWLIAVRAGFEAVHFLMFPVMLWFAMLGILGTHAARKSLFPLGYLYLAMPVWGALNPIFQAATVHVVRAMLRVFGIPSHFMGNFVQIPAGTFEIAGGCSGMHFFVVALAISVLMGQVRQDDWRGRLKLVVLAGTLALITNWIRVFTIILAGHQTDMQHYLVVRSHYGYGWVLFAFAMTVFFLLERRMQYAPKVPVRASSGGQPEAGLARPAFAVAVALVAIGTLQVLSARPALASLSPGVLPTGWEALPVAPAWQPVVLNSDAHLGVGLLSAQGDAVDQHQFLFLRQRQGKELGGYNNDLLVGADAIAVRQSALGGRPATLVQAQGGDGALSLIAASYSVGEHHYATPQVAQLRYAMESIAGLRSVPSMVTVWRRACLPNCIEAEKSLARLLGDAPLHSRGIP